MADYEISAQITADSSGFTKGIENAQKSTKSFSKQITDVINKVGKNGLTSSLANISLAVGGVKTAFSTVTNVIKNTAKVVSECTAEYRAFESGQKVLQQTLKVTGAEEWTNIEALTEMQNTLSQATNYSGGEIQQLQTVLLGFKSIKGDVFDQTTDAILDMATVMGMDLTNATQAVAKALDDPIKGLGSLSRQGFAFSESQKIMIKNLVEAGKQAEAQKIILDELNTTYGGASRSAVDSATQMKNAFSDLKRELGSLFENNIIGRIREDLVDVIQTVVNGIHELNESIEEAKKRGGYEERKSQGKTTEQDVLEYYEIERESLVQLRDIYKEMLNNSESYSVEEINNARNAVQSYTVQIAKLDDKYNVAQLHVEKAKEETEELKRQNELLEIRAGIENEVIDIKKQSNDALAEQERKWKAIEQVTGKTVSSEEKLKYYQDNLTEAVAKAKGNISETNQLYIDRMKVIKQLQKEIDKMSQIERNRVSYEKSIVEQHAIEDAKVEAKIKARAEAEERKKSEHELQISMTSAITSAFKTGISEGIKEIAKQMGGKQGYSSTEINFAIEGITTVFKGMWNESVGYGLNTLKSFAKNSVKIIKGIKTSISKIKNIFSGLVDFNSDSMLDELLKFEDGVLTFFMIEIPKLPKFVKSALGSIKKMFGSLKDVVNKLPIKDLVKNLLKSLSDNFPAMLNDFIDFSITLFDGIFNGVSDWVTNGGWETLLNSIISGLNKIMTYIKSNAGSVVSTIKDMIPALINFVKEAIKTISSTFSEISPALRELVEALAEAMAIILGDPQIIKAIAKMGATFIQVFSSSWKTFFDTFFETIKPSWISDLESLLTWEKGDSGKLEWKGKETVDKVGEGIKEGFEKVGDWLKGIFGHATGSNNVMSGLSLVGEKGPELVDFHGGERIYTAQNTRAIMNGKGMGGNNFNVTFNNVQDTSAYTMMKQLKSYNRQMAINGVL